MGVDGAALGAAELSGLAEVAVGVTELVVSGTAEGDGPVPGVGDVSVAAAGVALGVGDVPTAAAGVVLGAGEIVGVAGGKSFINSRRSSLCVLPLCA